MSTSNALRNPPAKSAWLADSLVAGSVPIARRRPARQDGSTLALGRLATVLARSQAGEEPLAPAFVAHTAGIERERTTIEAAQEMRQFLHVGQTQSLQEAVLAQGQVLILQVMALRQQGGDLRYRDRAQRIDVGDAVAFVAIGFDEGLDAGMGQGLARIGDLFGAAGVGVVERHGNLSGQGRGRCSAQRLQQRRRTQRTCPLLPAGCQAFSGLVRQQLAGDTLLLSRPQ
jgi:hypothetical protein